MSEKIEYETITVKVPKVVMDFLRKTQDNTTEALEYAIVDHTRAEMESMPGTEYIGVLGLKPVFYAVLGDQRFKSEE